MLKILTLSWEGKSKLEKLYPTLLKNLCNVDWEWHVKDNGSSDESYRLNEIWKNDKVNIIKYKDNKDNFAQGCNFLFKESSPKDDDLILLLNNDIVFNDEKSLSNMMDIIKNDKVGAVGAKLKYNNSNLIQHAGVVFARNGFPIHFKANQNDDINSSSNREFQACTGALLLIKSKYFVMDNKYFWCFEDIDTCLDIKYNQGKKIVCCGQTNVAHEESATLKKNPVNKLYLNQNLSYFSSKWNKKINIDYDIYFKNKQHNIYE